MNFQKIFLITIEIYVYRMTIERLVLEVFGGCNYTCQMCPQGTIGRDKDFLKSLPFPLFLDILDQAVDLGVKIINLEGSGEPTLNKNLYKYIEEIKKRNIKTFITTNGYTFNNNYFIEKLFNSGLDYCRFSVIGYDRETYKKWMNTDSFDFIKKNIQNSIKYIDNNNLTTLISSYHLILDNNNIKKEVELYKKNFINPLNIKAEIWKFHNWSGSVLTSNKRVGKKRKTCGRPFSNMLFIRAGGLDKKYGAVVPCCQTMGKDIEKTSVLGHAEDNSLYNIYKGSHYNKLREAHKTQNWDLAPFCKNCDFLYEDVETLVFTNMPNYIQENRIKDTNIILDKDI